MTDEMTNQLDESPPISTPAFRSVATRLLAAPVSYSLYFLIGYFGVEIACTLGFLQFSVAGMNAMVLTVLGLTALTLVVILLFGWPAYRQWRRARDIPDESGGDAERFAAAAGTGLALFFALLTVLTGVAVLTLNPCGWV
jgi:hypothetical protein